MALKWKIFRVICYLQIVTCLGFIIIPIVYNAFSNIGDYFMLGIYILVIGSYLADASSNLYLVEKFLPARVPPKKVLSVNRVLYVLLVTSSAITINGTIAILAYIAGSDTKVWGSTMNTLLVVMLITLSVTGMAVWYLQPGLRYTLKANHHRTFNQFTEPGNP
jgi:hypothetical protein